MASIAPESRQRPNPPITTIAFGNLRRCETCGFPVSEGRRLCLDCEAASPDAVANGPECPRSVRRRAPSWVRSHVYLIATAVVARLPSRCWPGGSRLLSCFLSPFQGLPASVQITPDLRPRLYPSATLRGSRSNFRTKTVRELRIIPTSRGLSIPESHVSGVSGITNVMCCLTPALTLTCRRPQPTIGKSFWSFLADAGRNHLPLPHPAPAWRRWHGRGV